MASKALLIIIMVAAASGPALAMDYMVGDANGWNTSGNYTQWAAGKNFRVGDNLMFMYTVGQDNVVEVNGPDFKACNASNALRGPYGTGNDTIALDAPVKRWFISGLNNSHCLDGVKLVVTVNADAPAPAPVNWAPGASAAGSFAWVAASATAAFWMIMA